ncbi:hypothetical protein HZA33_01730 [Candidatus Pacearchaeota archaeon]|nr:hypothetical protein [Candidatus Pacearchaeota archaeon]
MEEQKEAKYIKPEQKQELKPEKQEEKKPKKKGILGKLKEIQQKQRERQKLREETAKAKEAAKQEAAKQQLLQKSEISIWLDSFDDVFSDFDSRPYSHRAISDDFLRESQKMYKETKTGKFELHLLVPTAARKEESENTIKKRLKDHFKNQSKLIEKDIKTIKRNGLLMITLGTILLVIATLIAYQESRNLLLLILLTIFEPAGWFTIWTGLDGLIYESAKKKPELEYNLKMASSEINFVSY